MNGKRLVVLVAFGLGIGGYALTSALRGPSPATREGQPRSKKKSAPPRPAKAPAPAAWPDETVPEEPKRSGPRINPPVLPAGGNARTKDPPRPEQTIEQARETFDDLIAELDREIKRGEEVGRPLTNEDWVEYYRRGNEAMDPILRQIDRTAPGAQEEINDRMKTLRTKLDLLRQ